MRNFLVDFQTRVEEIDEYFHFVAFVDNIETHKKLQISYDGGTGYVPRRDLQKILRSNCFLLLYNVIESSIRNSILAVYDSIHDQSLGFNDLSERLQEVWISHKSRQAQVTEKTIKAWLRELMNEVSVSSRILLEKDSIQIAGNLNYENIQKIINSYGFFGKINGDRIQIQNSLNKVKRERNLLAHGNKTFTQSGEIILMSELIHIKSVIFEYLSDLLANIKSYIDSERYRK